MGCKKGVLYAAWGSLVFQRACWLPVMNDAALSLLYIWAHILSELPRRYFLWSKQETYSNNYIHESTNDTFITTYKFKKKSIIF